MVKDSLLSAGITSFLGDRHLETQTNPVYVWVLRYQPEQFRVVRQKWVCWCSGEPINHLPCTHASLL